jgi:hypothetical protein
VWVQHDGRHIGRYFCASQGPTEDNAPELVAINESVFGTMVFFAELPGSPYPLPTSEQALADWFLNKFSG